MLNVTHVFSDTTFLSETKYYNESFFRNTIIIIGENISINLVSGFNPIIVSGNEAGLKKVMNICSCADIVVLYELDTVKSYIALSVPQNITIGWRFFGAELYDRNIVNYLSKSSLRFYNTKKEKLAKLFNLKIVYGKLISMFKNRFFSDNNFAEAIERIDLFICLSEHEYNHLSHSWKNLPPFLQIPANFKFPRRNTNTKTDLVIIGNSRSIFNNHLDIIDLIENVNFNEQLLFLLPFSYGSENYYTGEIRRLVKNTKKNIELLENYMSYEAYFNLVSKAKAAVFNGYRQMAMGNICECINSGVKVYLNTHNIIYQWLKTFGIKIFTIEEFASDLESNNLELNSEDKEKNISALKNALSQFSVDQFFQEISTFIKKKDLILLPESMTSSKA